MSQIKAIRQKRKLSQKDFSEATGLGQSYVSELDRGLKPITNFVIEKLVNTFGDEILNELEIENREQSRISANKIIRYWADVDVTGGGVTLFDDTLSNNYEEMIIPEFKDCTDAVNLYGDSMSPRYNPGQIIILKEWTDSFIAYGQVYLVITKSGFRTVKYIRKGEKENEIMCVSENEKYDPFPIHRNDIHKLYLVKGIIEKTTL